MRKKIRRTIAIILSSLLFSVVLSACSGDDTKDKADQGTNTEDTNQSDTKNISGSLTIAGSTSMEKLANVVAEAFMEKYPKVSATAEFIGSSAGVEQVIAGTVDIGNASRNLKESEIANGAVENIVAIDGIAIILDNTNPVLDLTKDQLIGIYTGTITNWSEAGGDDKPIVVVGREAGSGTRGAFEEILGVEDQCLYSNEINSTGGVMAKVASTPGAIGYVSLDVLDETVKTVRLDTVDPTVERIQSGDYFLSRPFVMATKGAISEQNEIVQTFFDFMASEEGKQLVKDVGLITVD